MRGIRNALLSRAGGTKASSSLFLTLLYNKWQVFNRHLARVQHRTKYARQWSYTTTQLAASFAPPHPINPQIQLMQVPKHLCNQPTSFFITITQDQATIFLCLCLLNGVSTSILPSPAALLTEDAVRGLKVNQTFLPLYTSPLAVPTTCSKLDGVQRSAIALRMTDIHIISREALHILALTHSSGFYSLCCTHCDLVEVS